MNKTLKQTTFLGKVHEYLERADAISDEVLNREQMTNAFYAGYNQAMYEVRQAKAKGIKLENINLDYV